MPNFSRLILIAKALTCSCCRRRDKPQKAPASNQPYLVDHNPRRNASDFESFDYSQYSGFSPPTSSSHELPYLGEFEDMAGRDEFGLKPAVAARSLTPASAAPVVASTKPGSTKPDPVDITTSGAVHAGPAEAVSLPASPKAGPVTCGPVKPEPVEVPATETDSTEARPAVASSAEDQGKATE